jgi:hypothetical protein
MDMTKKKDRLTVHALGKNLVCFIYSFWKIDYVNKTQQLIPWIGTAIYRVMKA